MADEPKLIVALEARIDRFEKQLRQAGLIAEREMKAIEGKITAGTFIGSFAAQFAAQFVRELARIPEAIAAAIKQLSEFEGLMKRTALSGAELQKLLFAAKFEGIGAQQAAKDIDEIGKRISDAAVKTTAMGEFLKRNNIEIRNQKGEVTAVIPLLEQVRELFRKARDENERIRIAEQVGLSRDWVGVIEKLPQLLAQAKVDPSFERAAAASRELEETINRIKAEQAGINAVFMAGAAGRLNDLITGTEKWLNSFKQNESLKEAVRLVASLAAFMKLTAEFGPPMPPGFGAGGGGEAVPLPRGRPAGARAGDRSGVNWEEVEKGRNALVRAAEQLVKNNALLEAELKTVGLTVGEREKALELAKLEAAAKNAGLNVETAITEEMKKQAAEAGRLKQQLTERTAAFQKLNDASKEFGQTLADGFKDLVLEGKKVDEVLKSILNRLAGRSIDRLFDLFFAAPAGGGPSPLLQLLGFGGARMAGGPVTAGRPYLVGEGGPELFVPQRSGMVVPGTVSRAGAGPGAGPTFITSVDARGSAMNEGQFRSILAENNSRLMMQWNMAFPGRAMKFSRFGT